MSQNHSLYHVLCVTASQYLNTRLFQVHKLVCIWNLTRSCGVHSSLFDEGTLFHLKIQDHTRSLFVLCALSVKCAECNVTWTVSSSKAGRLDEVMVPMPPCCFRVQPEATSWTICKLQNFEISPTDGSSLLLLNMFLATSLIKGFPGRTI